MMYWFTVWTTELSINVNAFLVLKVSQESIVLLLECGGVKQEWINNSLNKRKLEAKWNT